MLTLSSPRYPHLTENEYGYQDVLKAIIRENDTDSLREYLQQVPQVVNDDHRREFDIFCHAASCNNVNVLELLLDYQQFDADPARSSPPDLSSLLGLACRGAHVELVRYLLKRSQNVKAHVNASDTKGWTPLLQAASAFTRPYDTSGYTALAHVARCEEILRLLISLGANIHDHAYCKDTEGTRFLSETVLSLIIGRAGLTLIKDLLEWGAETNVKIRHSSYPAKPYIDATGVTLLHIGSRYCNFLAVQELLSANQKLSTDRDSSGRLPLHWAAMGFRGWSHDYILEEDEIITCSIKTVETLLEHDAMTGLNAQDGDGKTPLHYAAEHWVLSTRRYHPFRSDALVQLLLEKGADPNIKDKDQRSPLHLLIKSRQSPVPLKVLDCFIRHGAAVRGAVDADGNTLLHVAATGPLRASTIKYLLDHGTRTDAGAANAAGDTPLHLVARAALTTSVEQDGVEVRRVAPSDEQDEVMELLEVAAADRGDSSGDDNDENGVMLDRPNIARKTPRQLRAECEERKKTIKLPRMEPRR